MRLRPWFGVAALLCLAASPIPYLGLPALVSFLATTGLSAMVMRLNAILGSETLAVVEREVHARGATVAIDDGPPLVLADCYVVDEGQDVLFGLTQAGEEVEILRGPDAGHLCDGLHERLVLDEGEIDPKLTALRQGATREPS